MTAAAPRRLTILLGATVLVAACSSNEGAAEGDTVARADTSARVASRGPAKVGTMDGVRDSAGGNVAFATPESVKYDEALDGYFVANINGNPSAKDNNGFIAFISAENEDSSRVLVQGGRGGARLNAPKGMAIVGDTLWVADIDAVRGFDKRTGRAVASVEFGRMGAKFLNDIAVGPDGALYITDTGINFDAQGGMSHPGPDRIFKVMRRTPSIAVTFDSAIGPNGIAWDQSANRLVVASFAGKTLMSWAPGDSAKPTDLVSGVGQFDGLERLSDGRWLVSSWADSSIYVVPTGGGAPTKLVGNVNSPADIGVDTKRNRVLIPLFMENRVEAYDLR
jgi:hypothetical protein